MPDRQAVRLFSQVDQDHRRELAQGGNDRLQGRSNNRLVKTLATGATATVIENARITSETVVTLTPRSQSAANSTGIFYTTEDGKITIHHDSSLAADRTFGIAFIG